MKNRIDFTFASIEKGQAVLSENDEYLQKMNPFERSLKMKTDFDISQEDYISFLKKNVVDWQDREISKVNKALDILEDKLGKLEIDFSGKVILIKTTGNEEWNSAYTRSSAIILPIKKIEAYNEKDMARLLAHELYHIISRKNVLLREELYSIIGFTTIDTIDFPVELASRRLTNPDAYYDNIYIELLYQDRKVKLTPIISLKENYENIDCNEDILESLSMKFIAIEKKNNRWQAEYENGEPIYLDLKDLPTFFDEVGRNVEYNIEPDEIIAENFTMLVFGDTELPSPDIIKNIRKLLQSYDSILL